MAKAIAARSQLLPNVSGCLLETVQQVDLAAFGFQVQHSTGRWIFNPEGRRAIQLL